MTYQADRTYWRAVSTRGMIEAARDSRDELAIALGERLAEYEAQEATIADLLRENKELEQSAESWREEVDALRAQLGLN